MRHSKFDFSKNPLAGLTIKQQIEYVKNHEVSEKSIVEYLVYRTHSSVVEAFLDKPESNNINLQQSISAIYNSTSCAEKLLSKKKYFDQIELINHIIDSNSLILTEVLIKVSAANRWNFSHGNLFKMIEILSSKFNPRTIQLKLVNEILDNNFDYSDLTEDQIKSVFLKGSPWAGRMLTIDHFSPDKCLYAEYLKNNKYIKNASLTLAHNIKNHKESTLPEYLDAAIEIGILDKITLKITAEYIIQSLQTLFYDRCEYILNTMLKSRDLDEYSRMVSAYMVANSLSDRTVTKKPRSTF